jgi:murein DD-endopeptidase MepM/ murein hydrolase activator NlpD
MPRVLVLLAAAMAASTPVAQATSPRLDVTVAIRARAIAVGEVVVVTMTTDTPADEVRLKAFDRDQPAFRDSPLVWRAIVGIDLDVVPNTYVLSVDARVGDTTRHVTDQLVVANREFPTRKLTVDDAYVNPPAAVTERITQEAKDLDLIWKSSAPARLWSGAFERPVPQDANSAFGSRSVFNGEARSPHSGADFSSPAGTPIHAPNAGKVVLARELYFTGNTVIIDHGLGLFSLMAHLSQIDVNAGDAIAGGRVVGLVGATGRVTGPHLHWGVRLGGARVDPLSLLDALGTTPKTKGP